MNEFVPFIKELDNVSFVKKKHLQLNVPKKISTNILEYDGQMCVCALKVGLARTEVSSRQRR